MVTDGQYEKSGELNCTIWIERQCSFYLLDRYFEERTGIKSRYGILELVKRKGSPGLVPCSDAITSEFIRVALNA